MSTDRPKAANVLIFNDRGEVLAVSRKDNHEDIGLPGGKLEDGEDFEMAARRECEEETGVTPIGLRDVFDHPCRVHQAHTFQAESFEGSPRSVEGAWVGWVKPERLFAENCSFREYNLALFKHLGMA